MGARPHMLDPKAVRRAILRMAYAGQSAHIGPALSCVEILCAIHERMGDQDELILSKAHAAMALYGIWHQQGKIGDAEVDRYFSDGSALLGHVPPCGALGHGLSIGVGLAKAKWGKRVQVVVGDGELNEGACWEAIMCAAQWRLGNLWIYVDANGYQGLGATQDILDLANLRNKFEVFGWNAWVVTNGNDLHALERGYSRLSDSSRGHRPNALICQTQKGYGVPFMQGDNAWHYNKLTPDLYEAAMRAVG